MVMTTLVFVYGTLMQDQPNHRVLLEIGAERLGAAVTASARTLVDLGPYPALLRGAGGCQVTGELYAIDERSLDVLDAFEGCPDLYSRERIQLVHDGESREAWTYVLAREPPADAVVVASGRYAGGGVVLQVDAHEVTRTRRTP